MSSNLRQNEREKNDAEKPKEKDEPRRQKLLRQIRDLELLIKKVELSLRSSPQTFVKFRNVADDVNKIMINHEKNSKEEVNNNQELVDTEETIKNELCWFAGLRSIKIDDGFVFEFQSHDDDSSYAIKILRESKTWKLDKWIMPMSIKIKDILANYTIDSPENIQLFIRECKHQIDCYGRRKKQYEELEAFFTDLDDYDYQLGKDYRRYMRIVITLGKKRFSSNDKTPIVVYLHYQTNETLPSKITIENDDLAQPNFKLFEEKSKKLTALFKPFKKNNLRKAAEKILLSSEGQSMWKRLPNIDDDIIEEDQDNDSDFSVSRILKKGSKKSGNNGAKRKKDTESDNETNETANSNDLSKIEISEIQKKGKRRAAKRKKN